MVKNKKCCTIIKIFCEFVDINKLNKLNTEKVTFCKKNLSPKKSFQRIHMKIGT